MDYTNNMAAMSEIANTNYGLDYLGGQNPYTVFQSVASKVNVDKATVYDRGILDCFDYALNDYYNGRIDKNTEYRNFYNRVKSLYPEFE